jgi:hypothetical protein
MIWVGGRRICSLLCVVAACLPLSRAAATTFVRMDERDLAARAVAVVIGTVESVEGETAADGAIVTAVVLLPERVLRGTLPPGRVTLRERGGTVGGRTEHVFGSPDYQVGQRVLVFLSRGGDGVPAHHGDGDGKVRHRRRRRRRDARPPCVRERGRRARSRHRDARSRQQVEVTNLRHRPAPARRRPERSVAAVV